MNITNIHHEIFTGARCDQKLGQDRKWLHSDALQHTDGDLMYLIL